MAKVKYTLKENKKVGTHSFTRKERCSALFVVNERMNPPPL